MKAVCFIDVEKVEVCEVADPQIKLPTDAIVQVSTAGLCGSDLHVYHGRETGIDVGTIMGHEFVGEVVEVGSAVASFRCGDRVASPFTTSCGKCFFCLEGLTSRCTEGQLFGWCSGGVGLQGAQAELVRVELADGTLMKIVPDISDEIALLLGDNLSTGFFCADLAEVSSDATCVVIGCGTVGLLTIIAAKERGARSIFAYDPIEDRRKMATELGATVSNSADEAIKAVLSETGGRGADVVMELVGLPVAQQLAFDILRPGGTLSVVGCHSSDKFSFSPFEAYDKNLTFKTGRCPARDYMEKLSDFATANQDKLNQVFTHHFPLDDAVAAYDVFANRKNGCLKAVLNVSDRPAASVLSASRTPYPSR